jgi:hypothetical protein
MLPVPLRDWIPSAYSDPDDPARDAFCAFMDSLITGLASEVRGVDALKDPARTPPQFLATMSDMLSAGIEESDPVSTKRHKVYSAVQSHKNRSTWFLSFKPAVDAFVGGDSKLMSSPGTDDWVLCGLSEPDGYKWAGIGGLDQGAEYGIRIIGGAGEVQYSSDALPRDSDQRVVLGLNAAPEPWSGIGGESPSAPYGARMLGDGSEFYVETTYLVEPQIKGHILVDVDSPSLTYGDVEGLKASLYGVSPAFLRIYLGFIREGAFIPYPNGLIGG